MSDNPPSRRPIRDVNGHFAKGNAGGPGRPLEIDATPIKSVPDYLPASARPSNRIRPIGRRSSTVSQAGQMEKKPETTGSSRLGRLLHRIKTAKTVRLA